MRTLLAILLIAVPVSANAECRTFAGENGHLAKYRIMVGTGGEVGLMDANLNLFRIFYEAECAAGPCYVDDWGNELTIHLKIDSAIINGTVWVPACDGEDIE